MMSVDPAATTRPVARRRFLGIVVPAVLGTAIAGLAVWRDWRGARARFREVGDIARSYTYGRVRLEDRVARHYDYLALDRPGVERFVRDYERVFGAARRRPSAESHLYAKYLLSTDFFINEADESKPVRYVMLHDPYASPCWTPFPPTRA